MGIVKLVPAVPVIMAGNVTLGIRYLLSTGAKIPAVAYGSLTITQLFTALGGAVVAAAILAALAKTKR